MPDITSVDVDVSKWHRVEESPTEIIWLDSLEYCTAILSLNYFPVRPDIPFPLSDVASLRKSYRAMAIEAGGGLMRADVIELAGLPAVETLFKFPIPGQSRGLNYIGSITLPFANLSYVIKVQSAEMGMTGVREAMLFARLNPPVQFNQEELKDKGSAKIEGLGKDPYDPSIDYPNMPTIFEDEQYDMEFPDHPLTKVRRWLKDIRVTASVDGSLHQQARFVHPASLN